MASGASSGKACDQAARRTLSECGEMGPDAGSVVGRLSGFVAGSGSGAVWVGAAFGRVSSAWSSATSVSLASVSGYCRGSGEGFGKSAATFIGGAVQADGVANAGGEFGR